MSVANIREPHVGGLWRYSNCTIPSEVDRLLTSDIFGFRYLGTPTIVVLGGTELAVCIANHGVHEMYLQLKLLKDFSLHPATQAV